LRRWRPVAVIPPTRDFHPLIERVEPSENKEPKFAKLAFR